MLISSVAFELMDEAYKAGGFDAASIGLLLGAVLYFAAPWAGSRRGAKHRKRSQGQQEGGSATAITMGALLVGPEPLARRIGSRLAGVPATREP